MNHGIHHITAMAGNAADTYYFYTKILGLRLVKKTVNQDDVSTYHLFFGDKQGTPGMDLTFFIFQHLGKGVTGAGQVSTVSFEIPESSLSFWQKRLSEYSVDYSVKTIFGKSRIIFFDPDNLAIELVGTSIDVQPSEDVWLSEGIQIEHAIRHFYSARFSVLSKQSIEIILMHVFGYVVSDENDSLTQYSIPHSNKASTLELSVDLDTKGYGGSGTVHHIAFRARDEQEQHEMVNKVVELGLQPTPVIDRFYFKSVYFRTPAGILFEIATDGPGFTADEDEQSLGSRLALPPFLEAQREEIEAGLPPLGLNN